MAHFDLQQSTTDMNLFPQGPLYNTLLMFTPESDGADIGPDLAHKWEASANGTVFTFYLREGVKFHDGATLTAEDVVASYNRILNPPKGVLSMRQYMFLDVEKVEAVDPLTVRFTLKRPYVTFLMNIANGWNVIYRKKTLEENNYNLREKGLTAPGTGAFKLGTYEPKEYYEWLKNPDYFWKGLPLIDGARVMRIDTEEARVAALLGGRADYAVSIRPEDYRLIKERRPDLKTVHIAYYNYSQFMFNHRRAPWNNPQVRRAVLMAFDKAGANYSPIQWTCGYAGGWLPQACMGGKWDRPESVLRATPGWRILTKEDIAEAKKLLAAAGFPDGIKNVDTLVRGASEAEKFTYQQDHLRRTIGLELKLRVVDDAVYYDLAAKGDFDIALAGGGASAFDDPNEIWDKVYLPGAPQNYMGLDDPELTALLEKMRGEFDQNKRRTLVMQMHELLDQKAPLIPTTWQGRQDAWQPFIKGLVEDPRVIMGDYNAPRIRRFEWAWV
jgi:peptide/nickel transport system substrate-binding protein